MQDIPIIYSINVLVHSTGILKLVTRISQSPMLTSLNISHNGHALDMKTKQIYIYIFSLINQT